MPRPLWLVPLAHLLLLIALLVCVTPFAFTSAAPAPILHRPAIEVCFCLDTTGSMTGLIDGAKLKIWAICNQILNARPTPDLKVALVAYRDKGDEYITRVHDLRDDLDAVYADLKNFVATGGGDTPEHVNLALEHAVGKIAWSTDSKTLRMIFLVGDAPPHMDYSDDVKYPDTCRKARARGILINAVQCGDDAECALHWRDIARKGRGCFVVIPQTGGVRRVTTPHDKRLGEINADLVRNTILFGPASKRESDQKKLAVAADLPVEAAADRAGYLAKEGIAAPYDLIDAIRAGKVKLEDLPTHELPAEMQKMTMSQRLEYLGKLARTRAALLREAFDLDRQRAGAAELQRNRDSFDGQVLEVLRKQAMSRRLRF
jgi:hypothetical protein